MSPLRRRMIEDMQIRNLTANTQRVYVAQVFHFACHFRKSPDLLGPAEIRTYLIHLTQEKHLASSSIIVTVAALRFFYTVTLKRSWVVADDIPAGRQAKKLPGVLSQDEVARFLGAVDNLKQRMVLTVCYATGLRISEAVHLTAAAIDSKRMVIRVEQGKGRKDRYVMLPPKLLDMLLLEEHPSRRVAVSRSLARPADLSAQHQSYLPGGEPAVRYRQTSRAAFSAPRVRRSPA
jgi:integrase/recombinase XerD